MPEATIIYESPGTLKFLKYLSKYFNFAILSPKTKDKGEITIVNGVTMVRKSKSINSIDDAEMNEIMERSKMEANELRGKWQRKK